MSVAYGRFTAALGVLEEKWLGSVNFYILKKLFEGFEDTNKKYAVFKRGTKEAVWSKKEANSYEWAMTDVLLYPVGSETRQSLWGCLEEMQYYCKTGSHSLHAAFLGVNKNRRAILNK